MTATTDNTHFVKPTEGAFYARERKETTILFGGLTVAHEEMLLGCLTALGYKAERLPVPDFDGFTTGKEYCNRGQCNPTYYTVGNLIDYLRKLQTHMSKEEIEKKYVFFTAGSCGPCRFGMYESEYRKGVREAGFDNFRILIFQQAGGTGQFSSAPGESPGVNLNKNFVIGLLKAIMVGDLINSIVAKLRPYEIIPGATIRAKTEVTSLCRETMANNQSMFRALRRARKIFSAVECDYTQIKPVVKITGEFWASITEGHGNYFLKEWLWNEGAEVLNEPLTGWVEHLLFSREIKAKDRRGIAQEKTGLGENTNPYKSEIKLFFLRRLLNACYNYYRFALGFKTDNTTNNRVLAKLAHEYYNKRQGGGEAYMEVGGLVYIGKTNKAHMMISVKPFGCLPSTASDGVQSKVMSDYPNVIFVPLETTGDSEVHFKSRAQMKLFEAKQRARAEADELITRHGIDVAAVKTYVQKNPRFRSGMFKIGRHATGTGARFLIAMQRRMRSYP